MGTEKVADLSDAQCREIAGMASTNHIWLNAFTCIKPTDELKMQIGTLVLDWLNQKDNLIPSRADHECSLAKLTPVLYMSVNKS